MRGKDAVTYKGQWNIQNIWLLREFTNVYIVMV